MVSEIRADAVTRHYLIFGLDSAMSHFRLGRQSVERYIRLSKTKNVSDFASRRVLVIGDLHEPFTREGYREHCIKIYEKWQCNEVVFIGDIIDNHFSSFHDTDPDGHSAAAEFELAKTNLDLWHDAFPVAKVCIGNHDSIPDRKGFRAGLSKRWIKSIDEVLNFEGWTYADYFEIDSVQYVHGIGRKARQRGQKDLISIVQGHYHSESYTEHYVGKKAHIWVMQIGCGIDDNAYAMAYGKHFNKSHINCGVVLDNGNVPILEYMDFN